MASHAQAFNPLRPTPAGVVELVDAPDSKSGSERSAGSTPAARTTPIRCRRSLAIVRNHPEITDNQISKLIGTTKDTIAKIRDKSHWNIANITAKDPVTLGLTTQREMDALVAMAAKKAGIELTEDVGKFNDDRAAMIEQLNAERIQAAYIAEHGPAPTEVGTAQQQGDALFRR